MDEGRRLTRSESDRLLAGVCSGLGEHLGIDPTLVRIVFVLLAVFGGSGVVLYLALWLIVPRASRVDATPRDVVRDGVDEGRRLVQDGADAAKRGYQRMRGSGTTAGEGPTGHDPAGRDPADDDPTGEGPYGPPPGGGRAPGEGGGPASAG
jgi:phage shock protein PspC (stress-responsive transcriptional regulator)